MFQRALRIVATVVVVGFAWRAQAQPSEAAISAAIQQGLAHKSPLAALRLDKANVAFVALLIGPLNRIQDAAFDAAKAYKPFTRADVTSDMLLDEVLVVVSPKAPSSIHDRSLRASQIVLQTRTKPPVTIQPTSSTARRVGWTNGFGATAAGQGMTAWFALGELPPDDFEIVIVTQATKETRLVVKGSQRAAIQ